MTSYVIDASVAAKWVIEEAGTEAALALREHAKLMAPELLVAECANIFWKKVRRNELSKDEACLAARLIQCTELELLPTRALMESATRIAIELDHPAYDCIYLALALDRRCLFVSADAHFLKKLADARSAGLRGAAVSLREAAATAGTKRI